MSFGMNFTRVSLGTDGDNGDEVLFVEGESEEPDAVKAIYVVLARASVPDVTAGAGAAAEPQELPSAPVAAARGADTWNTTLPQTDPPFTEDETILAIGAGVPVTDDPPFFWHQTLRVLADDAVSERMAGTEGE
jgi:hypothetical protein